MKLGKEVVSFPSLLFLRYMGNTKRKAAKVVSAALLGLDGRTVLVGGHAYHIMPPTMKRIAQAAYYLSDMEEAESLKGLLMSIGNPEPMCKALSCFIHGDESLCEALKEGTMEEIVTALETAYSLVSVENFWRLSALARNVANLTANQRS